MVGLGGLEPPTVPYLDTALPVYKTGSLPLSYSPFNYSQNLMKLHHLGFIALLLIEYCSFPSVSNQA